jgi:tRNA-2-methylthio-N6-dimethylallyladenosine synthase
MQGCDNFCAYCIVPYVRGRQKSRGVDAVLRECRMRLERGAREITLLGQNVNSYGQDTGADGPSFSELLYRVAALPGLERLRFITSHPKDLAPELIAAFRELPVLAPRLHLPLQSGSDRILAAMGRRYDRNRFRDIVRGLREARPKMHLSTDVIVGFPGETEADFQDTLSFMREIGFAGSFSFVYSDRPKARAVLFPGKVDRAAALDRLARLQEWQYAHAWTMLRALTGETVEVLLEEPSPKPEDGALIWQGKEPRGHAVNVRLSGPRPENGWRAAIVPTRITGAAMHSLRGEQAGPAR